MNQRIILAALAAISIFSISPADARQGSLGNLQPSKIDAAAIPAYPFPDQIRTARAHGRAASLSRKASRTADRPLATRETSVRAPKGQTALADRTLNGYASAPEPSIPLTSSRRTRRESLSNQRWAPFTSDQRIISSFGR